MSQRDVVCVCVCACVCVCDIVGGLGQGGVYLHTQGTEMDKEMSVSRTGSGLVQVLALLLP